MSTLGDLSGVAVGHWTDAEARTGVTVVVLPEGSTASAEVRGGAPATREFDVLAPSATVTRLDAVVLSGGSAFGLASADGVVSTLAEAGRGFVTAGGVVPIVAAMSLFDQPSDPHRCVRGPPRAQPPPLRPWRRFLLPLRPWRRFLALLAIRPSVRLVRLV